MVGTGYDAVADDDKFGFADTGFVGWVLRIRTSGFAISPAPGPPFDEINAVVVGLVDTFHAHMTAPNPALIDGTALTGNSTPLHVDLVY